MVGRSGGWGLGVVCCAMLVLTVDDVTVGILLRGMLVNVAVYEE